MPHEALPNKAALIRRAINVGSWRCSSCLFFLASTEGSDGWCRATSPTPTIVPAGEKVEVDWPFVTDFDACGDWEPFDDFVLAESKSAGSP